MFGEVADVQGKKLELLETVFLKYTSCFPFTHICMSYVELTRKKKV